MDIGFFNKWLHVLSIAGMLGGVFFAWIVLVPTLRPRSDGGAEAEAEEPLAREQWKRFGITLGVLWLIILATGFLNMSLVTPHVNGRYQMFLGMKIALAIIMFIVSLLIAHPMPAMRRFFRNRSGWLLIVLVLGIIVVGISAHLNISRVDGTGLKPVAPAAAPVASPAGAPPLPAATP